MRNVFASLAVSMVLSAPLCAQGPGQQPPFIQYRHATHLVLASMRQTLASTDGVRDLNRIWHVSPPPGAGPVRWDSVTGALALRTAKAPGQEVTKRGYLWVESGSVNGDSLRIRYSITMLERCACRSRWREVKQVYELTTQWATDSTAGITRRITDSTDVCPPAKDSTSTRGS